VSRGRRPLGLARATLAGFHRDRCFDQSALVAFYCLLSLAPFVYVAGVVVRRFLPGPDPVRAALLHLSPLLAADAATALTRLIESDLAQLPQLCSAADFFRGQRFLKLRHCARGGLERRV